MSALAHPAPSGKQFSSLRLSPALIQVVAELGYEQLTPIQAESIPLLMQGADVIGQSKTGSGKTAAFALPILNGITVASNRVQALVLCPTRELCTQVAREFRKFGRRHPGLQVLIVSGGVPFRPQAIGLDKGVHIVVGTPGRVLDHLQRDTLDLRFVRTFVLDEADRMLDMGFQEDMEQILEALPQKRQTAFFSATFPKSIQEMSATYQTDAVRVTIEDAASPTAASIRQCAYEVRHEEKVLGLLTLLQERSPTSAIVFCNQKATVDELCQFLNDKGVSVGGLHGDLEQRDRDRVMARFRNRSIRVLIATDVAARGIDVDDLDVVFNYDLPNRVDAYVHRIGRSGRAGKDGLAISLHTARESGRLRLFESHTGSPIERERLSRIVTDTNANIQASMTTLFIGGGRKEKMRPGDILGALTGDAGLSGSDVGKIEIHDHFSYVAISKAVVPMALRALQRGTIKGRSFRVETVR